MRDVGVVDAGLGAVVCGHAGFVLVGHFVLGVCFFGEISCDFMVCGLEIKMFFLVGIKK